MATPHLNEGQSFVEGRSRETAADLLARAEKLGLKNSVVTTSYGYIVPSSLLAESGDETVETEETQPETEQAPAAFDPSDHTVADVQAYLDGADEDERERVLSAEKDGKARKSLLADDSEGAK